MTLSRCAGVIDTPEVRPNCTAKVAVSSTAMSSPPSRTNACRLAMPSQPMPGRMSSVESILPMFGVSSVVFHGRGLPNIGMPGDQRLAGARPTGGNRMTSYLRAQDASLVDVLGADVGERHLEPVERLAPPAFVLGAEPGVHQRDARRRARDAS